MFEQDIKYLKYKTYLSCYCPHCKNTFNEEKQHEKSLIFNGNYKKQDILIKPEMSAARLTEWESSWINSAQTGQVFLPVKS